jgi:hypothetical protein
VNITQRLARQIGGWLAGAAKRFASVDDIRFLGNRIRPRQTNRSWTDPVSNLILLHQLKLRTEIPRIASGRPLPLDTLQSFLHESTHQWCFSAPVGKALALLTTRARNRAWFRTGNNASKSHHTESPGDYTRNMFADVVRAAVSSELLRPLAEGMALYAEFDAVPGASKVVAQPLVNAQRLYTPLEEMVEVFRQHGTERAESIRELFELYERTLLSVRSADEAVERKLNLLCQPLDVEKGGYLAGYLAVKQLIATMRGGSERAQHDSSLCLMFLRNFFYCDMGLVATILAPGEPNVFAERLVRYLQRRFRQFDELARTERRLTPVLKRIEEEYLREDEGVTSHTTWLQPEVDVDDAVANVESAVSPIETPEPLVAEGRRLLRELILATVRPSSSWELLGRVQGMQNRAALARRDFISFGTLPVDYQLGGDDHSILEVFAEGQFLLNAPLAKGVDYRPNDSSVIELIYDPIDGSVFASCTSGAFAVAVRHLTPSQIDGRREAVSQYPPRSCNSIEAETQLMTAKVEDALEHVGLDKSLHELTNIARKVANRLYTQWMEANDKVIRDAEQCRARMERTGFWTLAGGQRELLRALTITSVLAADIVPERGLADVLAEEGIEWPRVVAEFDRLEREHGYKLVARMHGMVLSNV